MIRAASGHRLRRRVQGLAFLVVVAALVSLTIAIYNKSLPWQAQDTLYLQTARIGDELTIPSDVKLDGVLVGRVSAASSNGNSATLTLKIDKSQLHNIPSNVQALILPKTLFGDKYVDLQQPSIDLSAPPIANGATIQQDDSHTAIELQTVFQNLLPLLRTLNPVQLSTTLTNVSEALQGQGEKLGQNLVLLRNYFRRFNPDLPNFNHDIEGLTQLASNYADVTPDLLATLRNFAVTAKTFSDEQVDYASFLANAQGFAVEATNVIGDNSERLIRLAQVSRPVIGLYASYAKVLECLPNGLAIYDRSRLEGVFGPSSAADGAKGVPALHITLTPVGDRGTYTSKPTKKNFTGLVKPADCYGLPYGSHGLHPVFAKVPTYKGGVSGNYAKGGATIPGTSNNATDVGTDGVGSATEQTEIATLLAQLTGRGLTGSQAALDDLMLGPMLRGMVVSPS